MKAAIIAAIITGLFTVGAGFITIFVTQKEGALTYQISESPVLLSPESSKQIFVVTVSNSGRREISGAFAQVILRQGNIEQAEADASPGLKISTDLTPQNFTVSAEIMNPGEQVKLSLLLDSQSGDFQPDVVVRAPGVTASPLDATERSTLDPIIIAATTLGAMTSVLVVAAPFSRRLIGTSFKLFLPGNPFEQFESAYSLKQNEVVAYICGKAGLTEEAQKLRFSSSHLSYRGAADYLMLRALDGDESVRERYASALKAMLLNTNMSVNSVAPIRRAISIVSRKPFTDEQYTAIRSKAVGEGTNPSELRDRVDELLATEMAESGGNSGGHVSS